MNKRMMRIAARVFVAQDRIYIESRSEAPRGVTVHKGDNGRFYYSKEEANKERSINVRGGTVKVDMTKKEPYRQRVVGNVDGKKVEGVVTIYTPAALEKKLNKAQQDRVAELEAIDEPTKKEQNELKRLKGKPSRNIKLDGHVKTLNVDEVDALVEFDPESELGNGLQELVVKKGREVKAKSGKKRQVKPSVVYSYSESRMQEKSDEKYGRIKKMVEAYDGMMEQVAKDMRGGNGRARQVATIVKLIDLTKMRVGSTKSEKETGSIGATTLKVENVNVRGNTVSFDFPGKSGVQWKRKIRDRILAKNLKGFMEGKGANERVFSVKPTDVNRYLKQKAGVTSKDFRTYHGTALAVDVLQKNPIPPECTTGEESEKKCEGFVKKVIKAMAKVVADALGNTPAVALAKYISPSVVEAYSEGGPIRMASKRKRGSGYYLTVLEEMEA